MKNNEWIEFAKKIEKAGADALELNIYFLPIEKDKDSRVYENAYLDLVSSVTKHSSLPVMVKLGHGFTNITWMVNQLYQRGAASVILFNRLYAPDIDTSDLSFGIFRGTQFSGRYSFPSEMDRYCLLTGK